EVADHVVVVDRLAVELLEQVEHHVRPHLLQRHAQGLELVVQADLVDLVAEVIERHHHVVLGLERIDLLVGEALEARGRHEVAVHHHQDPESARAHTTCHCAVWMRWTVWAVSSTTISMSRVRSLPAARRRRAWQRAIISLSTWSTVTGCCPVPRATSARSSERCLRRNAAAVWRPRSASNRARSGWS